MFKRLMNIFSNSIDILKHRIVVPIHSGIQGVFVCIQYNEALDDITVYFFI